VFYCLQDCLREIDQDRLAGLSRSCEFDMCHVKNDITDIMCSHAQAVVEECQITTGVTVTEWRTPDFCGKRFCSVWSSFRTGKTLDAFSACGVNWCFDNPPTSDMDFRIFNVRM